MVNGLFFPLSTNIAGGHQINGNMELPSLMVRWSSDFLKTDLVMKVQWMINGDYLVIVDD